MVMFFNMNAQTFQYRHHFSTDILFFNRDWFDEAGVPAPDAADADWDWTAFTEASDTTLQRLFVPYGDTTNVKETYRAGRYLDLDRTATGLYDLDFNRAYHRFCLFNPTYECPIPPRENHLDVAIRAGERLPGQ